MTASLAGMAAVLASAGVVSAGLAGIGAAEALVASWLVGCFARQRMTGPPVVRPPVTVLKPLHGNEPLLRQALATLCGQDYPDFQIVFGVQDAADPAVAVVRRLRAGFPDLDIALTIDPTLHGRNRKVGNLINMMAAARHDVLVIADADVHVSPDYLDRLVAALQQPGVGLVTTLYAGLPAGPPDMQRGWFGGLSVRLGATQITHGFLPGAVLARALGRQDCLGATMCLRRRDLQAIGGLRSLVDHLADDAVLGRRIAALGLSVALARTVPLTTVPEASLRMLFRHELRWARTIRALEPAGFAASVVRYPLAWALATVLLTGGALWSLGIFMIAWVLRAVASLGVDSALAPLWSANWRASERGPEVRGPDDPARGAFQDDPEQRARRDDPEQRALQDEAALAFCCPVWLLPLRDVLSVAVMLASYGGRQVDWRGHRLHADTPPPFAQRSVTNRSLEGTNVK